MNRAIISDDGSNWIVSIGDEVLDDLTGKSAKIVKFTGNEKIFGIWLDNDYLDGGRHIWEISKLENIK